MEMYWKRNRIRLRSIICSNRIDLNSTLIRLVKTHKINAQL